MHCRIFVSVRKWVRVHRGKKALAALSCSANNNLESPTNGNGYGGHPMSSVLSASWYGQSIAKKKVGSSWFVKNRFDFIQVFSNNTQFCLRGNDEAFDNRFSDLFFNKWNDEAFQKFHRLSFSFIPSLLFALQIGSESWLHWCLTPDDQTPAMRTIVHWNGHGVKEKFRLFSPFFLFLPSFPPSEMNFCKLKLCGHLLLRPIRDGPFELLLFSHKKWWPSFFKKCSPDG